MGSPPDAVHMEPVPLNPLLAEVVLHRLDHGRRTGQVDVRRQHEQAPAASGVGGRRLPDRYRGPGRELGHVPRSHREARLALRLADWSAADGRILRVDHSQRPGRDALMRG